MFGGLGSKAHACDLILASSCAVESIAGGFCVNMVINIRQI